MTTTATAPPARRSVAGRGVAGRWSAIPAAALQLLAAYPYAASGLLAPMWAIVVLFAFWTAMSALAVVVHRRYGAWVLVIPPITAAAWYAAMLAGESLLGWTP